jgi:hypothetical protein
MVLICLKLLVFAFVFEILEISLRLLLIAHVKVVLLLDVAYKDIDRIYI